MVLDVGRWTAVSSKEMPMLDLFPLSPTIGAQVQGLDLTQPLDDKTRALLIEAITEWKVLFFRDQDLSAAQLVALARGFGELEVHPFAPHRDGSPEVMVLDHDESPPVDGAYRENIWHSDVSWRELPSMASVLRAVEVPPVGGDTLWSDMYAAYEGLNAGMRTFIDGLRAVHDFVPAFGRLMTPRALADMRDKFPPVEHPVVRTHPVTGRKLLYVNSSFTVRIVGMDLDESRALLAFLTACPARPEYQCRFRWQPGSVAMWDNRCTQHYAVQDYWPQRRVMQRVTIIGDRPV
jgi:taurine dioxygenase